MTRKGSDVRGATIAKAAPQVIVGCGYLTDVILSGCSSAVRALDLGSRGRGLESRHSDQGRKISKLTVLRCLKKPICAVSMMLIDHIWRVKARGLPPAC